MKNFSRAVRNLRGWLVTSLPSLKGKNRKPYRLKFKRRRSRRKKKNRLGSGGMATTPPRMLH